MRTKGPELETVIRGLHSSKIRVGFQTSSGGIAVWISDELYLVREDCVFDHANQITTENSVARWLHSTTLRLFPEVITRSGVIGRPIVPMLPPTHERPAFHRPLRRQAYAASHLKRVGKGGRPNPRSTETGSPAQRWF
jgi:hypothetical protein